MTDPAALLLGVLVCVGIAVYCGVVIFTVWLVRKTWRALEARDQLLEQLDDPAAPPPPGVRAPQAERRDHSGD